MSPISAAPRDLKRPPGIQPTSDWTSDHNHANDCIIRAHGDAEFPPHWGGVVSVIPCDKFRGLWKRDRL